MIDEFLREDTDGNEASTKSTVCANCRKRIDLGKDLLIVEKGVLGPRGPIPLSEPMTFCSDSCTSNYFNGISDEDLDQFPPRIP